ncbi:MAG: hypothetical protein NWR72_08705 [Bacteroidia bacterium]|nr:hypothetical protein [Bacteroidia bacterium]
MSNRLWIIGLLSALLVGSCQNQDPIDLLPADLAPAITLVSPTNNSLLREVDESFTVTVQLADNEALRLLRVTAEIYNQQDILIGSSFLVRDMEVSGTNVTMDYTDKVPQGALPYYKVKYTCHAIDSKGEYGSAFFWVSVLPQPTDPAIFEVRSYTSNYIFNSEAPVFRGFNFTNREQLPNPTRQGTDLDYDIREISKTARQVYSPRLSSPSNAFFGQDSVFVITSSAEFNYDQATYETIFNEFFADPAPYATTPPLLAGDIVIVRLTKAPRPQFAVMKITEVFDDGPGINIKDELRFDYKVTSKP